ncbi:MAG TPA: cupin domain-containing protein [Bryobacteraceae bacterium]|jgi:mannose-6-phosphate isomerase-like protein (cupin superfamily)
MHFVSRIDPAAAQTPSLYTAHSTGFRRSTYVDHSMGSVHMGTAVSLLDPHGLIQPHLHSFEESFYVLEGSVLLEIGDKPYALGPGHFGLIPTGTRHSWRNTTDAPVRWLETQSPQPRPADRGRDTFFQDGEPPTHGASPTSEDKLLGHFDDSQLPRPGFESKSAAQMEGFNPTTGVAIKMFVDRSFGAIHQSLFLIQYMPGAKIDPHDHTFEESYLIVSGRVRATTEGHTYDLGPGDVIWTSVGCIHAFENLGPEPVRWIETQAPLPPSKEVFRFERDWPK